MPARAEGLATLLDGTDILDFWEQGTGAGSLGTSLGIDAIAEFQMLTNTYGAQFGSNGVMNAVSKSGTGNFKAQRRRRARFNSRCGFNSKRPPAGSAGK